MFFAEPCHLVDRFVGRVAKYRNFVSYMVKHATKKEKTASEIPKPDRIPRIS